MNRFEDYTVSLFSGSIVSLELVCTTEDVKIVKQFLWFMVNKNFVIIIKSAL